MSLQTFILGTAVKITTVININTATSAKIKIEDPGDVVMVSSADMIKEANKVYSYIYQSASTDDQGVYTATITVTSGGYTSVTQDTFEMRDQ